MLDWKRYFEFEKHGHKFTITKVFDEPKEKNSRTGNNIKNIKIMIDYLQRAGIEEKWLSMTGWYCEELKLLNKNICNLFYGERAEIQIFCKQNKISDVTLFHKYVTYAKSELKEMFVKSLKYLEKKNLVEYVDGYLFIYKLGKRTNGYVRTELLNDIIKEYETTVCNEMNIEYELSEKLVNRQLLFLIYREKNLYTQFNQNVLSMLMENQDALDILYECAVDQNDNCSVLDNTICKERPLLSYHKEICITNIEEQTGDCDKYRVELCNLIRKKVRTRLLKEYYISQYVKKRIYPYDDVEKMVDVLRIEKLLFQQFDLEYEDGTYYDVLRLDMWDELNHLANVSAECEVIELSFDKDKWIEDEGLPF